MTKPLQREGQRLLLREWRSDEVDALHRWLGDPKVTRFLSWGSRSRSDSREHLALILAEQQAAHRTKYFFALELKATGQVIGDCGFTWSERKVAEIGYFLEPDFWGQGYGTEAARLVIGLAFDLGAPSVRACCDARNGASEGVMRRCGMTPIESDTPTRRCYALDRDS
ncbi:MAG: GNAT family N-acetyltransferase [Pseudomonadota bacterium]